jgi:hypothetical protein
MLGMGAPLIANYQTALFYPPTWVYYCLYTLGGVSYMAWGQAVMVVLHLSWAAIGMALLVRQFGLGKLAQIIAGLAFGLSGYLVSRAGFLSINAAAAWMPWFLLGVTKLVDAVGGRSLSGTNDLESGQSTNSFEVISAFLLLVLSLTMQLLAGHAQTLWYTLILASVWVVYLAYMGFRKRKRSENSADKKRPEEVNGGGISSIRSDVEHPIKKTATKILVSLLILFGIGIIFAVGLAAVQLLPTVEYLLQSQRSAAVDYDFAMTYSFWPWRFLTFIAPDLYGNPVSGDYWGYANYWEDAVYIGLIPFILAIMTLISRGRKTRNNKYINPAFVGFLFALILVTFLLALGKNTPVFPWLYKYIPTFAMFQAPTRLSIIAIFCLTLLAAIGADSWRGPGDKGKYWLRLGVMAAAAITIGAGATLLGSQTFDWGIRPSFIRAAALLGFWGMGLGILALKAPERDNSEITARKWGWWQWAVVLWVGADLIVAGWGLNPGVDLRVYSEPSPAAEEVNSILDGGRLYLLNEDEDQLKFERFLRFDTFQPFDEGEDWDSLRATLLPNVTILDAIPSANNFDPLIPGRYANWIDVLQVVELESKQQMLNLMGVEVVERIDSTQEYGVRFDARETFHRYRWVPCGLAVETGAEALEMIQRGQVNFQSEVILELDGPITNLPCDSDIRVDINIKSEVANKSVLAVNSPNPGYLIMADVWYPGWQSFVDDIPTPVLKANYLFRAITLPAGEHIVTFAYQPKLFYMGALVSGVSLIVLIVLILYWFGKKKTAVKN